MLKKFAAALVFSGLATSGSAGTISAADPDGIMQFLDRSGVSARLGEDDYGDPNIRVRYRNTNFSIYFYGCSSGQNCDAIQLYSGYRTEGAWPQDQANVWNQDRRYAKAYVAENGSARLEFDIYTGSSGIEETDFSNIFMNWTKTMGDFEEVIGW